jgi:hypothetical protein
VESQGRQELWSVQESGIVGIKNAGVRRISAQISKTHLQGEDTQKQVQRVF